MSPVITQCGHVFCRLCIEQVVDTVKPPTCPLCREVVQKKDLLEAGQDEDAEEGATDDTLADMEDIVVDVSSSKINAALKEMLRIRRHQPGDMIIVVSQFTSFLYIPSCWLTSCPARPPWGPLAPWLSRALLVARLVGRTVSKRRKENMKNLSFRLCHLCDCDQLRHFSLLSSLYLSGFPSCWLTSCPARPPWGPLAP